MDEVMLNELKRLALKMEKKSELLEIQNHILKEYDSKMAYIEACEAIGVEDKECLNEMAKLLMDLYVISEDDVEMQLHVLKLVGVLD